MSRLGYYPIAGLNPVNRREEEFFISVAQVSHLETSGPECRFYELRSVESVLRAPVRIYKGLKRDGKGEALCYVGRPRRYGDGWESEGSAGHGVPGFHYGRSCYI